MPFWQKQIWHFYARASIVIWAPEGIRPGTCLGGTVFVFEEISNNIFRHSVTYIFRVMWACDNCWVVEKLTWNVAVSLGDIGKIFKPTWHVEPMVYVFLGNLSRELFFFFTNILQTNTTAREINSWRWDLNPWRWYGSRFGSSHL